MAINYFLITPEWQLPSRIPMVWGSLRGSSVLLYCSKLWVGMSGYGFHYLPKDSDIVEQCKEKQQFSVDTIAAVV